MTGDAILPGCVLHWDGFTLSDGEEGHKYFVVVGAQSGKNFLAILATSRRKGNRTYDVGGNHEAGWYLIPGGGKDFFKKDTWLLYTEPQEFSTAELLSLKFKGQLKIVGNLRPEIANAICNSMRKCEDVSAYHISLLGPAHQPNKTKS